MAVDCPNFAESAEQNGTVPLSEAISAAESEAAEKIR